MIKHPSQPNYYFWSLATFALILTSLGLALSWQYGQLWLQTLWHLCRAQLQNLGMTWQLIIPTILLVIMIRGGLSFLQQVRATIRLTRVFYPLREAAPDRLQAVLSTLDLAEDHIIFLKLLSPRAFCLGFLHPRIWLTSGLVDLLSDEELTAVLVHEAHHCRQRDPLRLVISRTLKSAFFFLPLVTDLAKAAELQQEIAADQVAISHLGNDLPLLCALQKLLQQDSAGVGPTIAAYSPFNITEARLRRLIYPPAPTRWRIFFAKWIINVSIILVLATIILLSARPVRAQNELISCTFEPFNASQTQLQWLDNNL